MKSGNPGNEGGGKQAGGLVRWLPLCMTPLRHTLVLVVTLFLLAGCAGVKVSSVAPRDYIVASRGDILSTGTLSSFANNGLQVLGMESKSCMANIQACMRTIQASQGLSNEQLTSTLSELWLQEAITREKLAGGESNNEIVDAYLQSARQAYAYLFLTERRPDQRALDGRQMQVRDYYNFSVQQAVTHLFKNYRDRELDYQKGRDGAAHLQMGSWKLSVSSEVSFGSEGGLPKDLIPASSLNFKGLRNQYRRDGAGAMLVAVTADRVVSNRSANLPYSESPFPAMTAVISFPGESLEEVLGGSQAVLTVYDPYRHTSIDLAGTRLTLAADFTSGYGLWLARSGFATQSILSLIGKGDVIEKPRVYLLQPYDPKRRTVVMLHGLASSPEAWINVANEVLGDEVLRQNFQIWQVYYPTNVPLAFNNLHIREALEQTLRHFDPKGTAPASQDIVLVGHSMGGVLSRLMVSSSRNELMSGLLEDYDLSGYRLTRAKARLQHFLNFSPLPQVGRAVFIAAPHRGTPVAGNAVARWIAGLVTLPVSVLSQITEIAQLLVRPGSATPTTLANPINGITNLHDQDAFISRAADLPISPRIPYHSVIGNDTPDVPLQASSDGIVPYQSAHLPGAVSEKIIVSGHSVQETPEAILEIRRILHSHLEQLQQKP